jgi:PKD repeat protein
MKIDIHVVRRIVVKAFLSIAVMAGLTILATATSAQDDASAPASAPPLISVGSPNNSAASEASNLPIGAVSPSHATPNVSMLAVPVVGNAPLTVDFFIGLTNTSGSLLYEWNFGDGAEAFLPAEPYMLHVYQNPGTYLCELELVTPRGISTTAFAKITVKPR